MMCEAGGVFILFIFLGFLFFFLVNLFEACVPRYFSELPALRRRKRTAGVEQGGKERGIEGRREGGREGRLRAPIGCDSHRQVKAARKVDIIISSVQYYVCVSSLSILLNVFLGTTTTTITTCVTLL